MRLGHRAIGLSKRECGTRILTGSSVFSSGPRGVNGQASVQASPGGKRLQIADHLAADAGFAPAQAIYHPFRAPRSRPISETARPVLCQYVAEHASPDTRHVRC